MLNTKRYNPDHLKSNFSHLKDVPIQPIYPGYATLIIGTEFSKLLWNEKYREGRKTDPYANIPRLCVLMVDNNKLKADVSFNNVQIFDMERF